MMMWVFLDLSFSGYLEKKGKNTFPFCTGFTSLKDSSWNHIWKYSVDVSEPRESRTWSEKSETNSEPIESEL